MTYAHIAKGGSLRFTQWYDFMDLTNYILGGGVRRQTVPRRGRAIALGIELYMLYAGGQGPDYQIRIPVHGRHQTICVKLS